MAVADDERITIRIGNDLESWLNQQDHLNVSSLARDLLRSYITVGDTVEVGLERRLKDAEQKLERKEMEKTRVEQEIEQLRREIDRIEQKLAERRSQTPEEVIKFAQRIESNRFNEDNLTADNPAVQNHAQKAGISPTNFIQEVETRLDGTQEEA